MEKAGCDLFLDVHGDEIIPETFIAGAEGVPGWTDRLAELKRGFQHALLARTRDFQTERGYGIPPVGKANIKIATNWVGDRFDCLSATLEMPFKDAGSNPDETYGFSPGRCAALGEACLGTMAEMLPRLR
jgi:murein tripeptide amidase MpaA